MGGNIELANRFLSGLIFTIVFVLSSSALAHHSKVPGQIARILICH